MDISQSRRLQAFDTLPPEILLQILGYLNRPWKEDDGPVTGRMDVKSLRLVSRSFAAVSASILFQDLYISRCFERLEIVQRVARDPDCAHGVKRLVCHGGRYGPRCLEWADWRSEEFYNLHISRCDQCMPCWQVHTETNDIPPSMRDQDAQKHLGQCAEEHLGAHLKLYQKLYKDWLDIVKKALDYQCLVESLPAFPSLHTVIYRPSMPDRYPKSPEDPPPCRIPEIPLSAPRFWRGKERFQDAVHLLRAVGGAANKVTALDVVVNADFLDHLRRLPAEELAQIVSLFSRLHELHLCIVTEELIFSRPLPSGVLDKLLGAAKQLQVLDLSFSAETKQDLVTVAPRGYFSDMPLSGCLGPAASMTTPDPFPHLKSLLLAGLSITGEELIAFLLAHRKLQVLHFDSLILNGGQWAMVGAAAALHLPWTELKCNRLIQTDSVHQISVPEEWRKSPEWHEGFDYGIFFKLDESGSMSRSR
ncbi:hypothetical protein ASPZODRAFT_903953 [Penicilliopsis zonata CBS 506.65]|uniref:F-box domain-containing protein n=1 Tax=Penicilliopsis zonata CBS 506.65 TaxID=1073090 RepID=A0A1L9S8Z8_9EURO|nr:hypothetical protein ASPZODRAFT_903953 [Penicilliopsis zonata CBS 506.65]OJJ43624.1 hypothetical protein ASPZODRAFT_903953 [Penicilliopsis zonata CBS 506.65]